MSLDFAKVANNKKATKKEKVKPLAVIKKDASTIILKPIEAKAIIEAFFPSAEKITKEALSIKVIDDKTRDLASEMGVRVKNLIKDVKKATDGIIEEPKKFTSEISNGARKITSELERGKSYLADELIKDKQRRDLEERKRQEAIRKADEERRKALEAEAKKLNIEVPEMVEVKAKKEKPQTRTDSGMSFAKGRYTYEVLNIKELAREYLVQKEDSMIINQAIRQGVRDEVDEKGNITKPGIPGLRIFFKENVAFR